MRLQCPNCDAEYEVDAAAIPLEGRDVQCSNCGHGWFQSHPDYETDYELEAALYDPPPPLLQGAGLASAAQKRPLDPEAERILREEVAREAALRAAEQAPMPPAPNPPFTSLDDAFGADTAVPETSEFQAAPSAVEVQNAQNVSASAQPPKIDFGDIEAELDAAIQASAITEPDPRLDFGLVADPETAALAAAETAPLPATEAPSNRVSPRRVARLKGLNALAKAETDPIAAPILAQNAPAPAAQWENVAAQSSNANLDTKGGTIGGDLRGDLGPLAAPRKTGRRAGIYTAILIALAGAGSYVTAPDLAELMPQLAPALQIYTENVNIFRDQVQIWVPQAIGMIGGLVGDVAGWLAAQGWL